MDSNEHIRIGVTPRSISARGFGPPYKNVIIQRKKGCLIRAMLEVNFFTSFASLIEPSKCRLADWLAHASGKI